KAAPGSHRNRKPGPSAGRARKACLAACASARDPAAQAARRGGRVSTPRARASRAPSMHGGAARHCALDNFNTWPMRRLSLFRPFHLRRSDTLIEFLRAIEESVSPLLTV